VDLRTGSEEAEKKKSSSTSKFHSISGENESGFLLWYPFGRTGLHVILPYT
jgi:hypothetical protein